MAELGSTQLFAEFHRLMGLKMLLNRVLVFNGVIVFITTFIYFTFDPKLPILLFITKLAYKEIMCFMVINLTIILSYSIIGHLIYGDYLWEYSNLTSSFFQILMIIFRKFEYDQLVAIHRYLTPVFVYSFLGLAYTLFLKMFIIILDFAYNDYMNSLVTNEVNFLTYVFNILFDVINALLQKFFFYFTKINNNSLAEKNKNNRLIRFLIRHKTKIDVFLKTKLNTVLDMLIKIAFIITGEKYTFNKGFAAGMR